VVDLPPAPAPPQPAPAPVVTVVATTSPVPTNISAGEASALTAAEGEGAPASALPPQTTVVGIETPSGGGGGGSTTTTTTSTDDTADVGFDIDESGEVMEAGTMQAEDDTAAKQPQGIGALWTAMWTAIWTKPPATHTKIQGYNDGTQDLFKTVPKL